jgi:tetratricopeptide (TPR) repeat protein
LDETRRLGEAMGIKEQIAMGLTHIANSQALMLQFDRARATFEDGLRLCREIGDRQHEAQILAMTAPICYLAQGELATARQMAAQGLAIAAEIGDYNAQADASRMLGIFAHQQGAYEAAIAHYQRYLDSSRAIGFIWSEAEALCLLGTAYLDISTSLLDRVFGFHSQAKAMLEQPSGSMMGATAWAEIGFCLVAAGKLEQAREYFLRGLTFPTMTINLERPRLLVGRALVNLQLDQLDAAAEQVSEAQAYTTEKGLVFLQPHVSYAGGCVAAAQGQLAEALAHFERAEQLALSMEMRPILWQARAKAAQALSGLGRRGEAEARRAAARSVVADMAGLFQDAELREHFLKAALSRIGA